MGNEFRETLSLCVLFASILAASALMIWDVGRVEKARCLANFSEMGDVEYRINDGCVLNVDGKWLPVRMTRKLIPEINSGNYPVIRR